MDILSHLLNKLFTQKNEFDATETPQSPSQNMSEGEFIRNWHKKHNMEELQKQFEEQNLRKQNLLHIYISSKIDINPHWEIGQKVKQFIDDNNIIINNEPPFTYAYAIYKGIEYSLDSFKKNDLDLMIKLCKAELKNFVATGTYPNHTYFERAAIIAHKQKNYQIEVDMCEMLIFACDTFNEAHAACISKLDRDVRDYVYYKKTAKRLEKAKALLAKQQH